MGRRKKPLTCESRKINLIIRKNIEIPLKKITSYCEENFDKYAFIEHKGDINEFGEVEGTHYHICGDMKGTRIAFSTRLNTICRYFGFDNAIGIEIDQYDTLEGAIQYLTHKRFLNKTQHDKNEIHHNLNKQEFDLLYSADIGNVLTAEDIYRLCFKHNSVAGIILEIGKGVYMANRSIILDMWKSVNWHSDYISKGVKREHD